MTDADQSGKATAEGRSLMLAARCFIVSAAVILVVTGLAKLWTVASPGKMLLVTDPITGLAFGRLLLLVGLAELAIAAVCLFGRSHRLALGLIAWLASSFAVYRLGVWWMGWKKPCGCLGNLTDVLTSPRKWRITSSNCSSPGCSSAASRCCSGNGGHPSSKQRDRVKCNLLTGVGRRGQAAFCGSFGRSARASEGCRTAIGRGMVLSGRSGNPPAWNLAGAVVVLAFGVCGGTSAAVSIEDALKRMIACPPETGWVKYRIQYSDSFTGIVGNQVWQDCEVRWDTNAFLFSKRPLEGESDRAGRNELRDITGRAGMVYWHLLDAQRTLHVWTNRPAGASAEGENLLPSFGAAKREAARALSAGLPDIAVESIVWNGNVFTGTNWMGQKTIGSLASNPEGIPELLTVEVGEGEGQWRYRIRYNFEGQTAGAAAVLPRRADVFLIEGGGELPYYSILVEASVFGPASREAGVFEPEAHFYGRAYRKLIYLGNTRVMVEPGGRAAPVLQRGEPDGPRSTMEKGLRRGLILSFLFATCGALGAALWMGRSKRKQQHQIRCDS